MKPLALWRITGEASNDRSRGPHEMLVLGEEHFPPDPHEALHSVDSDSTWLCIHAITRVATVPRVLDPSEPIEKAFLELLYSGAS